MLRLANAEGVRKFQPGAAPRVKGLLNHPNSERVRLTTSEITLANSFRVVDCLTMANPGRCPGLDFTNAFGVGASEN
jgi:hypothetical protein